MARRPAGPLEPKPAQISREQMERGIRRLQRRLQTVEAFDPRTLDQRDPRSTVRPLSTDIETALTETFGNDTVEYNRFQYASQFDWPLIMGGDVPHHRKVQEVAEDRLRSIQLLTAAIDLLKERLEDHAEAPAAPGAANPPQLVSKRIFIVHGHEEGPKEAVARFLTSLGYEPVILHEQANRGRTIIQKFQDEAADVGFAVVLMTPDDSMPDGRFRARQNVVLELGFFLGRLGTHRVAAIVRDEIERPSDFDGVLYVPFDGGWKQALARELQAADYPVDWNIVMR